MSEPDLSVLMVVHSSDDVEHLSDCLESISQQTVLPSEVIIVSDGYLHKKHRLAIGEYKASHLNYLVYVGPEKLPGALNLGLKNAKSELIARMDPDDIARPRRFELQLLEFMHSKVDVCGGQISEFLTDHREPSSVRRVPKVPQRPYIYFRNPMNHMTVIFRKSAVNNVGNYDFVECFEDWHLWLKLYKSNYKFRNLGEVLVDARIGNGFHNRRFGHKYMINEVHAINRFKRERLIPRHVYYLCFSLRIIVRVCFHPFKRAAYKILREL